MQRGNEGSAKICRGYPNAYGVPVKRTGCLDERVCHMQDELFDAYIGEIDRAIARVPRDGRPIYIHPRFGIGLEMHSRAPKCYEYLMKRLKEEFNYETK